MTNSLSSLSWRKLYRQHYRAIRAAARDHRRVISKAVLEVMAGRATPKKWAKYTVASTVIKLVNNSDSRIANT